MENWLIRQSMQLLLATLPQAQAYLAPTGRHDWVGERPDLFGHMAQAWFTQMPLPADLIPVQVHDTVNR